MKTGLFIFVSFVEQSAVSSRLFATIYYSPKLSMFLLTTDN